MVDYPSIAKALADGLNGMQRSMGAFSMPKSSPEFDRWKREMSEASKHVLMAFGIDPELVKNTAIPCGGGWFVERGEGDNAEWRAVEKA
jgi:hypothetical protein